MLPWYASPARRSGASLWTNLNQETLFLLSLRACATKVCILVRMWRSRWTINDCAVRRSVCANLLSNWVLIPDLFICWLLIEI